MECKKVQGPCSHKRRLYDRVHGEPYYAGIKGGMGSHRHLYTRSDEIQWKPRKKKTTSHRFKLKTYKLVRFPNVGQSSSGYRHPNFYAKI